MRQGISTRYMGPTNSNGSRIKATARKRDSFGPEMAATEPRDYGLNEDADHTRVAKVLAAKLGWSGLWIGGGKPDQDGYQYVNAGDAPLARRWAEQEFGREDVDWFYIERREA